MRRHFGILLSLLCLTILYSPAPSANANIEFRIGGSGTDLGTMKLVAKEFMQSYSGVRVVVLSSLGSSGAVKAVVAGKLDLGLASRALKKREQNLGVRAIHYARTPLIFAVAKDNPISSVTVKQLVAFYSGDLRHWDNGADVRIVLRPQSDSDTLLLRSKIPELSAPIDTAYKRRGVPVAATDQDIADLLSSVPGALGTSTLALVSSEQRPIKSLSLNGVFPTPATIADGSYPLAKALYFIAGDNISPTARLFLKYMASAKAVQILKETGHQLVDFDIREL
jgi:phosphate transport system substrate-binding protein